MTRGGRVRAELTLAELRQVAITTWVINALCVGLFVTDPDAWSAVTAVIAMAACGAATYDWLTHGGTL